MWQRWCFQGVCKLPGVLCWFVTRPHPVLNTNSGPLTPSEFRTENYSAYFYVIDKRSNGHCASPLPPSIISWSGYDRHFWEKKIAEDKISFTIRSREICPAKQQWFLNWQAEWWFNSVYTPHRLLPWRFCLFDCQLKLKPRDILCVNGLTLVWLSW